MEHIFTKDFNDILKSIRSDIPRLIEILHIEDDMDISTWKHIVDGKLLPRLSPDFPLMAAICGGGSSGKSTLFNSILKERVSPSGGSAGINRRILVSAPGEIFRQKEFLSTLFEPFGVVSEPLKDKQQVTTPGCPLYVLNSNVPRNMVLMDTPDFDTGAKGAYTNRDIVSKAMESSDILIYIFTNSNYNNRDNTDFIARMLTGIGMRKCFLVYRVSAALSDHDALTHSMIVARNIYGHEADRYLLGIYRADEDNAVAAGYRFVELKPVRPNDPPFIDALKQIDPRTLRPELLASILKDVLDTVEEVIGRCRISLYELQLYLDTLQTAQSLCTREALRHFPMDQVLKRFADIWMSNDPSYIRLMRKTGNILGLPGKLILGIAGWIGGRSSGITSKTFIDSVEEDLTHAVNMMRHKAISPEITVSSAEKSDQRSVVSGQKESGQLSVVSCQKSTDHCSPTTDHYPPTTDHLFFRVFAHPAVFEEQEKLRTKDWESVMSAIISQKNVIIKLTEDIEKELYVFATEFREKMDFSAKAKQTLSAFLNVLPATVAITYVLSTGDPVGAAGIKVKLASLFGIKDLYALVAIPATTGISKADRNQLESLLAPIATAWLNNKMKTVQKIFETEITGGIIRAAKSTIIDAESLIKKLENINKKIETENWKP